MRVWLNDRIMDEAEARISPFDRGFLFGDGVYEGIRFFNRMGVCMDLHVQRLARSLKATGIRGFDPSAVENICEALLDDAKLEDALIYIQITRGVQLPRTHLPSDSLTPTVFAYADAAPSLEMLGSPVARACRTTDDLRWKRCEIKCVSLLANVLAIMEASSEGYDEPIFHKNGHIGEGAMTNVFLIKEDTLRTPPVDEVPPILHGVTRALILDVAPDVVERVEIRPVTIDELHRADEVMIASSRRLLDSVTRIDDAVIGSGVPGPYASELLMKLQKHLAETCGIALHS